MASPRGRVAVAWLGVALCVAMIWTLSGASFSAPQTSRFIGPLLRWLFPEIGPRAVYEAQMLVRKAAHVGEYALLAALALRAWRLSLDLPWLRHAALSLALVLFVAGVDELRQSFLPERTGAASDVALDLAGGALGVALLTRLGRRRALGGLAPQGAPASEDAP